MGLFTKAPLDADFEQALHGNSARTHRKEISNAQELIRASLEAGERLTFIFCGEFIFNWTLVFTNSRMLVFKCVSGFKLRIESLAYSCRPEDIRKIYVGPTGSGVYGVIIETRQAPDGVTLKTALLRDSELIGNVAIALRDERRL
jgi:hypothetical protein